MDSDTREIPEATIPCIDDRLANGSPVQLPDITLPDPQGNQVQIKRRPNPPQTAQLPVTALR